jgi:hypothetical protein
MHSNLLAHPLRGLAPENIHLHDTLDRAQIQLPGKGLARYRAQGSARLQPLPIRTAREVFPQAAHPVSFVERVIGRLGHEGYFHENCSALGSGWIFQSQYRPSPSYKYSLLHRHHPMFRLRLSIYPSPQLLQTMGAFIISPLPHLDERSTHRSGPFPPGAFGCTPIDSTTTRSATRAPTPPLPTHGYRRRLLDEFSSPGTTGFSS